MSDDEALRSEPDLSQFDPARHVFKTEEERAQYVVAFEALREAAREAGVQRIHARMVAQPTVATLNQIVDRVGRGGRGDVDSRSAPAAEGQPTSQPVQPRGFVSTVVADGVTFVEGLSVNWVIVAGEHGPVLIDTGYPGDFKAVVASLRDAGWGVPDLVAILITHGHGDHIGNAAALAELAECPVYAHVNELANIRRDILEQVRIPALLPHVFRRRILSWARHAVTAGGMKAEPVLTVFPFPGEGPERDALGVDVQVVPLPGHTRGHTGYLLPTAQVLVLGDALVTAHPTSPIKGPQLLPSIFHGSPARASQRLQDLATIHAEIVLPGHGPFERCTPKDIAERALQNGAAF